MTEIAAFLACAILAALSVFQLLLMLGAPLGNLAWGGAYTVLPSRLRIGSAVSIVLNTLFAVIILGSAGLMKLIDNHAFLNIGIWALTGYFFIGVAMNAISRSKPERSVMTPVALALAVLCLLIALN